MFAFTMSVMLCACSDSSGIGGSKTDLSSISIDTTYSSPENAIQTFIDAVKSGDIEKITASFAIQDCIDGYNPDSEDASYIPQPTLTEQQQKVYKQLSLFYMGFQLPSNFMSLDDSDIINALTDPNQNPLIDPKQCETLSIMRVDLPETEPKQHEDRISRKMTIMTLYGADDWDYRTALLSLNGEAYYCGFSFAVYNGKFEITDFTCPLVPMNANLVTIPCTEEEYLGMIQ